MAQHTDGLVSLGIGEERMPRGRHICYVFGDDDERFCTLARYIRAGFDDGDKLLYITDELSPAEIRGRFAELGTDLGPEARSCLRGTAEAFHPTGRFIPEAVIADLTAFCRAAEDDGFGGVRCGGEMSWARRDVPGSERLLEYEVMLNDFFEGPERVPMTGICQYDVRLFDGPTILALLEIHPFLLLRGQILRNPNHVRTAEMRVRLRAAVTA